MTSTDQPWNNRTRIVQGLFLFGGFSVVAGLAYVSTFVSLMLAIKGSYALLALPIGWSIYNSRKQTTTSVPRPANARWSTKGVFVVILLSVGWIFALDARLAVLAVALPIGYALLLTSCVAGSSPSSIVTQACGLFVLDPLSKHLSTGFYFGNGDTLGHVGAIESLVQAGQSSAIEPIYPVYESIPGMHVTAGTVHLLTGLSAYESLVAITLLLYVVAIVCIYLLARSLLGDHVGTGAAIGLTVLAPFHYFAGYAFPQSFTTALVIAALYIVYRGTRGFRQTRQRFAVVVLPVVAGAALSHHLTILLFTPLFAFLVVAAVGRSRITTASVQPRLLPLGLLILGGVLVWSYRATGFLSYFYSFTRRLVFQQGIFATETGGGRVLIEYGTTIETHTAVEAAQSLAAADGIYYLTFTALVIAGGAVAIQKLWDYGPALPILAVGLLGSVVLLPLPVIGIINRFRLPLSFFVAFVVGVVVASIISSDIRGEGALVTLLIVLLVATTAPFVAGDDLYDVHEGPNLYEVRDTPQQQTSFSRTELAELQATSRFVEQSDTEVSSLWITREAFNRFGLSDIGSPQVEKTGIRSRDSFVYRERWTEHQVGTETNVVGTMAVSRLWLQRSVTTSNKVYTTGSVGILHARNGVWLNGTVRGSR